MLTQPTGQPTSRPAGRPVAQPPARASVAALRPAPEGANIRTWIGFKHFAYLSEQAVLGWFRSRGAGPSRLFHEHGLGLALTDLSMQLPAVLDVDDAVEAEVTGGPQRFGVRLRATRPGAPTVLRGRAQVAAVRLADALGTVDGLDGVLPPVVGSPAECRPADVADRPDRPDRPPGPDDDAGFVHVWRVPYFYCQFSRRLAFSGYVRSLEEVVDLFLADRGLSVGTLLDERGWIPVVSRARVTVLADAFMEETVHTVLTVTDVLRDISFDARMDCYVERGGSLVHTATGRILHAYAQARGPSAGGLVQLDAATVAALTRRRTP